MEPASNAKTATGWVHRILKDERGSVISSRPFGASAFQAGNIRTAYVFCQNGLPVNVMYTVGGPKKRAAGFKLPGRGRSPRGTRPAVQVREAEAEAGLNHSRFRLRVQERVLPPDRLCGVQ